MYSDRSLLLLFSWHRVGVPGGELVSVECVEGRESSRVRSVRKKLEELRGRLFRRALCREWCLELVSKVKRKSSRQRVKWKERSERRESEQESYRTSRISGSFVRLRVKTRFSSLSGHNDSRLYWSVLSQMRLYLEQELPVSN